LDALQQAEGRIGGGELAIHGKSRSVVSNGRFNGSAEGAEMLAAQSCNKEAIQNTYALKSRDGRFSQSSASHVLRLGDDSQIASAIVESVMVDVINLVVWIAKYETVHPYVATVLMWLSLCVESAAAVFACMPIANANYLRVRLVNDGNAIKRKSNFANTTANCFRLSQPANRP
jgi:hypothetical protein